MLEGVRLGEKELGKEEDVRSCCDGGISVAAKICCWRSSTVELAKSTWSVVTPLGWRRRTGVMTASREVAMEWEGREVVLNGFGALDWPVLALRRPPDSIV